MARHFLTSAALFACAALGSLPAAAAEYSLDPAHTQAVFSVVHLAFTKVHGTIPLASGTVTTGANELPTAASATFDVSKLNTENDRRDGELKGSDWFDVTKYQTMTFVMRRISGTPENFAMTGDLTMHGVTKPITLNGKVTGTMTDARGRRHVGYEATTKFDRRDWGLTWGNLQGGALIAGYDVTIDVVVDAFSR